MSDEEIKKIEQYLKPTNTFLEWGSGGSTLYFSKLVLEYISIEYDIKWYKRIKRQILVNQYKNIKYIYCPPDNNTAPTGHKNSNPKDFLSYVNIVDNIPKTRYDTVLIDGRSRVACAKKILHYIDQNSVIFVHDFFNRVTYHEILTYYDIIDCIHDNQSLVVLKKK